MAHHEHRLGAQRGPSAADPAPVRPEGGLASAAGQDQREQCDSGGGSCHERWKRSSNGVADGLSGAGHRARGGRRRRRSRRMPSGRGGTTPRRFPVSSGVPGSFVARPTTGFTGAPEASVTPMGHDSPGRSGTWPAATATLGCERGQAGVEVGFSVVVERQLAAGDVAGGAPRRGRRRGRPGRPRSRCCRSPVRGRGGSRRRLRSAWRLRRPGELDGAAEAARAVGMSTSPVDADALERASRVGLRLIWGPLGNALRHLPTTSIPTLHGRSSPRAREHHGQRRGVPRMDCITPCEAHRERVRRDSSKRRARGQADSPTVRDGPLKGACALRERHHAGGTPRAGSDPAAQSWAPEI